MRIAEGASKLPRIAAAGLDHLVSERERSFAAASACRLIADGFSEPSPGLMDAVRTSAHDLLSGPAAKALPRSHAPTLRALLRAWRTASVSSLTAEHSRLFLGSGVVSLREGGYGDGLRFAGQPIDIADLNGFYRAFGFEISASAPNPPDHLGTEIEFVSLLHLKRALALGRRRLRDAQIVEHAMARFLEDHLGRWIEAFGAGLREAGACTPYALLAELAGKVISADCVRLGIRPRLVGCGTAADPMEGDALVCPLAAGETGSADVRGEQ